MAWNDQEDRRQNEKNRWQGRPQEGPPDLDEALRRFQQKLGFLFGGRRSGQDFGSTNRSGGVRLFGAGLIAVLLLAVYVLSGIYIVQPAERAVIQRFGRYVRTEGPGPHWLPRLVESKTILNVDEVKNTIHSGEMLTMDENIVNAEVAVQYRIGNAHDYLFNVVDPERTLKKVSESALRSVVGQSTLDEVIAQGRAEVRAEIQEQLVQLLDNYHSGLVVTDVTLQQTKAPEQVKAAFDDATKAQQDEERLVNQAEAYARKIIPIAQGRAERVVEEAQAYRQQVVLIAQGEAQRFEKLLTGYQIAPEVFRDRLYLSTLESVLSRTAKVLVSPDSGGNNLIYLPLDKMIDRPRETKTVERGIYGEPSEHQQVSASEVPDGNGKEMTTATTRRSSGRPTYSDAERGWPARGD